MSDSVAHPVLKDVVCSKKKYAYALLQGKSVWNAEKGYCDKEKQIQIGSIRESDGIGECIFNERFLSENPQFRRWRVFRVAKGQYEYRRKSADEMRKPQEVKRKTAARPVKSAKFGAEYFLRRFFERSATGRHLKALTDKSQYDLFLTLLLTVMLYGAKGLAWMTEKVRKEHCGLYGKKIDKDTILRLFKKMEQDNTVGAVMKAKCREAGSRKEQSVTLALDGTNIDFYGRKNDKARYGKSKSGNAVPIVNLLTLMDQITHELYGVMSYSGDVTDVSTVESVCRQLMYQGDGGLKNKLRLICDRGYWSVFNLSTMLDHGCGFLVNCNTARSNKIKQLILEHAANLQGYNGTAIFRGDEPDGAEAELLTAVTLNKEWSYTKTTAAGRAPFKTRAKIYVHIIFSHSIYRNALEHYGHSVAELNEIYREAQKEGSWKPAEEKHRFHELLTGKHLSLFDDNLIKYDAEQQRFVLKMAAVTEKCRLTASRVLVSDFCTDAAEADRIYRMRSNIEIGYRLNKSTMEGRVSGKSASGSFDGMMFLTAVAVEMSMQIRQKFKDYNAKLPLKERVYLPHNSLRCLMHTLDGVEAIVDENKRELIIQGGVTDEINEILSICGIKTFAALGREALAGEEDGLIVDDNELWGI